ncbi:serine/threonine protein kinase [Leptothermofonsia sp. ETS-13]|uniref:serine/threonine protein kinase n=1 Tax=Leptothermofonsia sp. ETS-13 TaxID=3035696 RepID=UPI003BA16B4A
MNLTAGAPLQNGKYILGNILGQSDLGITLKATQAYLNQPVVLKTLKPNPKVAIDFAQLKQRFLEETRRFAHCQHPGLVRLVDVFEESGVPFAVMDYVAGEPLTDLVQPRRPMSEAQAIQYVRQVGSALTVLHRQGLVHRDVKPKNLLRPTGADFVVLVDYRILHPSMVGTVEPTPSLTNAGYAAPEEYQSSAKLTAATDIYALAAVLYFLMTGQHPTAANLREQSPLPAPRKLQPDLSQAVESAILSGMEMNVQKRPPTIAAFFSLLPDREPLPPIQLSNGAEKPSATVPLAPVKPSSNGYSQSPPSPQPPAPQPSTSTQATRVVTPASSTLWVQPLPRKSRLPKALVLTAAIAAACGLGLGLTLRLSAVSGIGPKIFNTQQTFPPLEDWPGSAEPVVSPSVPPPGNHTPERNRAATQSKNPTSSPIPHSPARTVPRTQH